MSLNFRCLPPYLGSCPASSWLEAAAEATIVELAVAVEPLLLALAAGSVDRRLRRCFRACFASLRLIAGRCFQLVVACPGPEPGWLAAAATSFVNMPCTVGFQPSELQDCWRWQPPTARQDWLDFILRYFDFA